MLSDLTVGKPIKVISTFSLPLLLSTALQQLYNIADSVIIGRFTGSPGLAAIGAAYPITLFFVAAATGGAMGCSVTISQFFGAKKFRELKSAVFTALITLFSIGVVLGLLGVGLSRPLMRLLHAPEAHGVFENASAYLAIYSVGVIPMFVYNAATAIYTGLGDSRRPLYFLILSSVLNVILDIIAVGPLQLGVRGAAWATTISQAVAAILSAAFISKKIISIRTEEKAKAFDRAILKDMSAIMVPSIFQQSCVALAHTILQRLINSFDTYVVAGYEAASKLYNFVYMCLNTLGTALSSFVAQCRGAGKKKRILEGFKVSTILCFACMLVAVAILQIFPRQLMGLFVDAGTEQRVIEVGVNYLRIISPVYLPICFIITIGGFLRGMGHTMTFFLETASEFTVRVVMCYVLAAAMGSYLGVLWAWYFGSSFGFLICVFLFFRVKKRELADA